MRIIDNYADLPVGKYLDILALNEDKALDDLERQAGTIAILADTTLDEVLALSLPAYSDLARQAAFLQHEDKADHRLAKSYDLGGLVLVPVTDPRKVTAGQYIDFQTVSAGGYDRRLPEILSCILVPKGRTYGSGYDIADVQEAIRKHLSVTDALSLLAFFFVSLRASITASLTSSEKELTRLERRTGKKHPEIRKRIREARAMASIADGAGSQPSTEPARPSDAAGTR